MSFYNPIFRYTKFIGNKVSYDAYHDGVFACEVAAGEPFFPVFEVFENETSLSVRVHSLYVQTKLRCEFEKLGISKDDVRNGCVRNHRSYWDSDLMYSGSPIRLLHQRPETDIGLERTTYPTQCDIKLKDRSMADHPSCSDTDVANIHITANNDWEIPPSKSNSSLRKLDDILPDYLDFDLNVIRSAYSALAYIWEQEEEAWKRNGLSSKFEMERNRRYHQHLESKLFFHHFLEDLAFCKINFLDQARVDGRNLVSSLDWMNMQDTICRKRIICLSHLFDNETDETLDRGDGYLQYLLDEDAPLPAKAELMAEILSIQAGKASESWESEAEVFGIPALSIPAPQIGSIMNLDEYVSYHRSLISADIDQHRESDDRSAEGTVPEILAHRRIFQSNDTEICRRLRRRILQKNIRKALQTTCSKLLLGCSAVNDFYELQAIVRDPFLVWRVGLAAVDQMLQNSAPHDVYQITCLILVADVMRCLGIGILPDRLSRPFCTSTEFFNDLTRWRPHVETNNPKAIPVFDAFVRILWGKALPISQHLFQSQGNLTKFRELLRKIVSTVVVPSPLGNSNLGLRSPHPVFQPPDTEHLLYPSCPPFVSPEERKPPLQNGVCEELNPAVVILTGTAVFGAILAFSLSFGNPRLMADSMKMLREWCGSSQWGWASTLARNCWLIASLVEISKSNSLKFGGETNAVDKKSPLNNFLPRINESRIENPSSIGTSYSPIITNADSNTSSLASNIFSDSNHSSFGTEISTASNPPLEHVHAPETHSPLYSLCLHCKKIFTNIGNLNKHIKTACKEALKSNPTLSQRRLVCSLACGYTSTTKWNVQSHEKRNKCRERHRCRKRI